MTEAMKRTPLFEKHKAFGAKIVPFGGWDMPVSYTSVLEEHKYVREAAGIFDVSHMGEFFVSGPESENFLNSITINDVKKLNPGDGQYTAMCNTKGGMIDDLILYKLAQDSYLMCVNASNIDKDFAWVMQHGKDQTGVLIKNDSINWSQLAIQGPNSFESLELILNSNEIEQVSALEYSKIMSIELFGTPAYIARTGYTGEKGYEIYLPNSIVEKTWDHILETKNKTGIQPIGLGARDTLRLEACYLLYGNDMNDDVSPLEAGIGWATKIDAKDFIGKEALQKQKLEGVNRKIYAFIFEDKAIPRHGMKVYLNDREIGEVTSGSVLPTVGGAGGMALLSGNKIELGGKIEIDVRGKRKLATIVKRPLYSAKTKS